MANKDDYSWEVGVSISKDIDAVEGKIKKIIDGIEDTITIDNSEIMEALRQIMAKLDDIKTSLNDLKNNNTVITIDVNDVKFKQFMEKYYTFVNGKHEAVVDVSVDVDGKTLKQDLENVVKNSGSITFSPISGVGSNIKDTNKILEEYENQADIVNKTNQKIRQDHLADLQKEADKMDEIISKRREINAADNARKTVKGEIDKKNSRILDIQVIGNLNDEGYNKLLKQLDEDKKKLSAIQLNLFGDNEIKELEKKIKKEEELINVQKQSHNDKNALLLEERGKLKELEELESKLINQAKVGRREVAELIKELENPVNATTPIGSLEKEYKKLKNEIDSVAKMDYEEFYAKNPDKHSESIKTISAETARYNEALERQAILNSKVSTETEKTTASIESEAEARKEATNSLKEMSAEQGKETTINTSNKEVLSEAKKISEELKTTETTAMKTNEQLSGIGKVSLTSTSQSMKEMGEEAEYVARELKGLDDYLEKLKTANKKAIIKGSVPEDDRTIDIEKASKSFKYYEEMYANWQNKMKMASKDSGGIYSFENLKQESDNVVIFENALNRLYKAIESGNTPLSEYIKLNSDLDASFKSADRSVSNYFNRLYQGPTKINDPIKASQVMAYEELENVIKKVITLQKEQTKLPAGSSAYNQINSEINNLTATKASLENYIKENKLFGVRFEKNISTLVDNGNLDIVNKIYKQFDGFNGIIDKSEQKIKSLEASIKTLSTSPNVDAKALENLQKQSEETKRVFEVAKQSATELAVKLAEIDGNEDPSNQKRIDALAESNKQVDILKTKLKEATTSFTTTNKETAYSKKIDTTIAKVDDLKVKLNTLFLVSDNAGNKLIGEKSLEELSYLETQLLNVSEDFAKLENVDVKSLNANEMKEYASSLAGVENKANTLTNLFKNLKIGDSVFKDATNIGDKLEKNKSKFLELKTSVESSINSLREYSKSVSDDFERGRLESQIASLEKRNLLIDQYINKQPSKEEGYEKENITANKSVIQDNLQFITETNRELSKSKALKYEIKGIASFTEEEERIAKSVRDTFLKIADAKEKASKISNGAYSDDIRKQAETLYNSLTGQEKELEGKYDITKPFAKNKKAIDDATKAVNTLNKEVELLNKTNNNLGDSSKSYKKIEENVKSVTSFLTDLSIKKRELEEKKALNPFGDTESIDKAIKSIDELMAKTNSLDPFSKKKNDINNFSASLISFKAEYKSLGDVIDKIDSDIKSSTAFAKYEKDLDTIIKKAQDTKISLGDALDKYQDIDRTAVEKLITSLDGVIDKSTKIKQAGKEGFDVIGAKGAKANIDALNTTLKQTDTEIKQVTADAKSWDRATNAIFDVRKITAYVAQFYMLRRAINMVMREVIALDKAMTVLNITMGGSQDQYDNLIQKTKELAIETGSTFQRALEAVKIYANSTETAQNVIDKIKPSIMLSNISDLNVEDSVDAIQGIMEQFKLVQAESGNVEKATYRVADSITAISKSLKVDFGKGISEISDGIKTSGSIMEQASVSMERYGAMVSAIIESSRLAGSQGVASYL